MKARENPYAVGRIHALGYRMPDEEWVALLARLETLGRRGAILGPHGSGKTTLLLALAGRLAHQGLDARVVLVDNDLCRHRLRRLREAARGLTPATVVLLDGADRIHAPAWLWFRRACRKAGGLVVTSHRPGRLPTLTVCKPTPALLCEIVEVLNPAQADPEALGGLFDKVNGNLREALRHLYHHPDGS
jgi:energy-coupling factor transporter ATP-binding protein EcfA2